MFISPAFAQAAGGASGGGSMLTQLMPLVLIFAVFYFLLIRPQQKKAKEHKAMISAVRRGDKVVTAGGIMGKITKVYDDDRAMVEIAVADVSESCQIRSDDWSQRPTLFNSIFCCYKFHRVVVRVDVSK